MAAAVAGDEQPADNPLLAGAPEQRILLVLVTGDKGLAGRLQHQPDQGRAAVHGGARRRQVTLELIGRKGRDFFRKRSARISGEHVDLAAKSALRRYGRHRAQGHGDVPQRGDRRRLPVLQRVQERDGAEADGDARAAGRTAGAGAEPIDYIFEQPPAELLDALLPRYVEMEFYRALLESAAAEHAARMTAMDAATSNAADMIDKLTLYMNRVRQASITKEIIEVVSGAAAAE